MHDQMHLTDITNDHNRQQRNKRNTLNTKHTQDLYNTWWEKIMTNDIVIVIDIIKCVHTDTHRNWHVRRQIFSQTKYQLPTPTDTHALRLVHKSSLDTTLCAQIAQRRHPLFEEKKRFLFLPSRLLHSRLLLPAERNRDSSPFKKGNGTAFCLWKNAWE